MRTRTRTEEQAALALNTQLKGKQSMPDCLMATAPFWMLLLSVSKALCGK